MALDILVVDDEADIRASVSGLLRDEGYECRVAGNEAEAVDAVEHRRPNLVILDIWLRGSDADGLELLERLKGRHPDLPVVMFSGHGTIQTAVAAIKMGAYDFVEKPFKSDRLLLMVKRAIDTARLMRENAELRQRAGMEWEMIGASPPIAQLRTAIERVGPARSRVLIAGPAGSGKELTARLIHAASPQRDAPFVVLNCAATSAERLEIELFGSEQGYDGSEGSRIVGAFEQAHGGTLLLDEIGDMPPETQGKIVRVLHERTFQRAGGAKAVDASVRVIASSNRSLEDAMTAGSFRQDLYYRLNVVPISVPPLSRRREDIPVLTRYFMARSAGMLGKPQRVLAEDALATLQSYRWPGNVRQLRNAVEWILIMAPGDASDPVRADMLPPDVTSDATAPAVWDQGGAVMGLPLREAREIFERQYLLAQIGRFGGNVSRAAAFVGMERSALHRKLKALGVGGADRPGDTRR